VEIAYIRLAQAMPYYFRNADADEIFFVHKGTGEFLCDFGPLFYEEGDYIVVPRGTVFKWNPKHYSELLNITSFSEVRFPEKGMIGQHALFDPAVIRVPTPQVKEETSKTNELFELRIRRQGEITKVKYPHNPIDVVGWKGTLTVWQLNVRDIRPISSESYHLPPSAHTTFVANGFVVCSFLPRPLENGDPKAMKVPFYHSNIDYDEVLFYHAGQFFSRTGIQPGMLTFHPQGIHHGPQADAVTRTKNVERTNEIAIMIDTKKPLNVNENAQKFENVEYWKSWMK
jgi:homogentisate 1,2-dioxygenase